MSTSVDGVEALDLDEYKILHISSVVILHKRGVLDSKSVAKIKEIVKKNYPKEYFSHWMDKFGDSIMV